MTQTTFVDKNNFERIKAVGQKLLGVIKSFLNWYDATGSSIKLLNLSIRES